MHQYLTPMAFTAPLLLAAFGPLAVGGQAPDGQSAPVSAPQQDESCASPEDKAGSVDSEFDYVEEGGEDPAAIPVIDGIVWYGTWETAMAEMERTGRPVMLHMGSVRDNATCVPGVW